MDSIQEIGGRTYSLGTLPAVEAVIVEVAIAKVIGESLFKAMMTAKSDAGDSASEDEPKPKAVDMEAMGSAISVALAKMDSAELIKTMTTVFAYVTCDGKRIEINSSFTGRPRELWQVFIAALRFNFVDFFPEGLLTSISDKAKKSR